ncbi:biotin-dependent carboxyltransferase family protein [Negadavirga shengliensis]|uniref:Biotin-dependent carboxyltransferase family protein n=1 Tax=Negadavirga shengliensis TaxID=1389218 RepID=A0ABV9T0Q5_9BACT
MGKLIIQSPGLYTTVQDRGRFGHTGMGVPLAGPMDRVSFDLANHLARTQPGSPALEMYNGEIVLQFTATCQVAICGADTKITISGKDYPAQSLLNIKKGDTVKISPFKKGQWLYLAINGKLQSEKVMGSHSFFKGITLKEKFEKKDRIGFRSSKSKISQTYLKLGIPAHLNEKTIEVYSGPDYDRLPETSRKRLIRGGFTVSPTQNRMGIQLEETLSHTLDEILSCPVYPGTVQLTPSGKMIVLMRDAQVTGGYPRILQLSEYAVAVLAQKRPGEKIRFKLVSENKT